MIATSKCSRARHKDGWSVGRPLVWVAAGVAALAVAAVVAALVALDGIVERDGDPPAAVASAPATPTAIPSPTTTPTPGPSAASTPPPTPGPSAASTPPPTPAPTAAASHRPRRLRQRRPRHRRRRHLPWHLLRHSGRPHPMLADPAMASAASFPLPARSHTRSGSRASGCFRGNGGTASSS